MKKMKFLIIILLLLILSGCRLEKKIKNEYFSQDTLQKYELDGLPKGTWKDCVVWGDSFYFNIEKSDFENWIIAVIDYIDSREDIKCWGFAEMFKNSGTLDYPVTQYENSNAYIKDHDWLSIAFTTQDLVDGHYQNCYYISALGDYNETIDVSGAEYHYEYYMSLQERNSFADRYYIN